MKFKGRFWFGLFLIGLTNIVTSRLSTEPLEFFGNMFFLLSIIFMFVSLGLSSTEEW